MENLRVGLAQITSVDDIPRNFAQIMDLLEQKVRNQNLRLVCFPENALFLRLEEGGAMQTFDLSHGYIEQLAEWAKENKVYIHLGSVPLRGAEGVYNSSLILSDDGKAISTYNKMHLFDIHLHQDQPIRESDVFRSGEAPQVFMLDGWKIGQTICYDLRFAELFSQYAQDEVDLILVPSAFLVKTGQAHWHTLLRARAIESQCFIVASAQSGTHKSPRGQRETFGHSLIVDPWGRVLADLDSSPSLAIVELNHSEVQSVRRQIPMKGHRRSSLLKR